MKSSLAIVDMKINSINKNASESEPKIIPSALQLSTYLQTTWLELRLQNEWKSTHDKFFSKKDVNNTISIVVNAHEYYNNIQIDQDTYLYISSNARSNNKSNKSCKIATVFKYKLTNSSACEHCRKPTKMPC